MVINLSADVNETSLIYLEKFLLLRKLKFRPLRLFLHVGWSDMERNVLYRFPFLSVIPNLGVSKLKGAIGETKTSFARNVAGIARLLLGHIGNPLGPHCY